MKTITNVLTVQVLSVLAANFLVLEQTFILLGRRPIYCSLQCLPAVADKNLVDVYTKDFLIEDVFFSGLLLWF